MSDYTEIFPQLQELESRQRSATMTSTANAQIPAGGNQNSSPGVQSQEQRRKVFQSKFQLFIESQKALYEERTQREGHTVDCCAQHGESHVDMDKWNQEKDDLLSKCGRQHFSRDINLTKKENKAGKILARLREEMMEKDDTVMTGDYYKKLPALLSCDLYKLLDVMPKPVVHHIHLTAACPISFLVEKLCYFNHVYFSQKDEMFKVSKNGCDLEGYVAVNDLRKYWSNSTDFDSYLHNLILLGNDSIKSQESHDIWKYFQPKFMMTMELYNYADFFERILVKVCQGLIESMITVVEWKHIFGMVFDEDGPISLERELGIFIRVQKQLQVMYPLFQMKIVACGLKIVGKEHIQSQIDAYFESKKYTDMVIGFDMVNEEDFTPEIEEFLPQIYAARAKAASLGIEFPVYLHCGESTNRNNNQLYDAILLDTKRIGHGFHLAYHPELQKIVKEKQICIECCPVSNFVLGYVLDLRCHPARAFLHQGIPVSISPDDPGFMGYEGVTLDYLYCFLSWDLDIADLKKLVLNSITYGSITEQEKEKLNLFFQYKWDRFLDVIIGKHN